MHHPTLSSIFLFLAFFNHHLTSANKPKPSILWITAEDMSPVLGCYGDTDAITPNIDKLARESIKYTHAFASAPVCSPSRSCLTRALPPSMGTQHEVGIPASIRFQWIPSLLRKAGYYTTNNVKQTTIQAIIDRLSKSLGTKALRLPIGEKEQLKNTIFRYSI